MTFGEKLAKLRKENNYTQEQLAERLEVSRQSVSKWESDVAYPETDKLIRIARLFGCSVDYLLKEEVSARAGQTQETDTTEETLVKVMKRQFRERKSEKTVFGMPLYHVARNAHGFFAVGLNAKGVIAVGAFARGIVSVGGISLGFLSFGLLSLGLLAFGTLAVGLLALGAIALGLFAAGAIAVGVISCGALSVGGFSFGALSIGRYLAVGDRADAMVAIGKTDAAGTLYRHVGALSSADTQEIVRLLDEAVPTVLRWAWGIVKPFASG